MLSSTFLPTFSVSEENSLHCSPLQRPAQSVPEGSPQGDTWHWKYWKNQLYCKARTPLPNINNVTCHGGCWCPGAGSETLPQPIPACSWHSQMAPERPHPWHSPALSPGGENVPSEGQNPTQAERGGSLKRTREWGGGGGRKRGLWEPGQRLFCALWGEAGAGWCLLEEQWPTEDQGWSRLGSPGGTVTHKGLRLEQVGVS